MVLSEVEAEARLAALRRERDALDRAIADLALFLELGRRLADPAGIAAAQAPEIKGAPGSFASPAPPGPAPLLRDEPPPPDAAPEARPEPGGSAPSSAGADDPPGPGSAAATPRARDGGDDERDDLSEGVRARRAGRALIEASLDALARAGRPLHASEILAVLDRRGLVPPGRDPVAALNTRLWKRAGPGGPLRRLGDAVYALSEGPEDGAD